MGCGSSSAAAAAPSINAPPDPVPLRRLHWGREHFYAVDSRQCQRALDDGATEEDLAGYVFPTEEPGTVPLFQVKADNLPDHMLSSCKVEAGPVGGHNAGGWRNHGVVGYVYDRTRPQPDGSRPLYRIFIPATHDHFYTCDPEERERVLSDGANDEGIVGYLPQPGSPNGPWGRTDGVWL